MKDIEKNLIENKNSFTYYYYWIKLLFLSMFEWQNLPAGCDSDFIETNLFDKGMVCFANSNDYGIINLSVNSQYDRNFYDKPINFIGNAGSFTMECNPLNSVIVQNNMLLLPSSAFALYFAEKISKIDRIYDINLLGQKTPVIYTASKEEEASLQAILNNIYSNNPILKVKKGYDLNSHVEALETKVPFLLDKLRDEKNSCMAEILTFMGINNVNITKKERLITQEAESNNELINMDLHIFLSKRQEACEKINKLFGTNISVVTRKEIVTKFNSMLDNYLNKEDNNDTL